MNNVKIKKATGIRGTIQLPGDKSISHRSIMLSSIAEGRTTIKNFLMAEDCVSTMDAFRAMGVNIYREGKDIVVEGKGLRGLKCPEKDLYLGNSGTTMRVILGILSGQDFKVTLTGDESLSKRPMKRVITPITMMGAHVSSTEGHAPLTITGGSPEAITYQSPVASAQVKSAILLAGLYCGGTTHVTEPSKSRDHTERMLKGFGAKVRTDGLRVSIEGSALKSPGGIFIPSDISSAAFFMVAAAILKDSKITLKDVGVNPTRTGIIDILRGMGASVSVGKKKEDMYEPMADITVESSGLRGIEIKGEMIPRCIDELPAVMAAAAFAKGVTTIKGASELRVKETDRIESMVTGLEKMGALIDVRGDDIAITGGGKLKGAVLDSFGDHRTAMSLAVAGLAAEGETVIQNTDCIATSFPEFREILDGLIFV
ncbi:MAG: 3-phosphoshikimate 1-carboxyvinyltransferase [Candidatus Omnitrophota bacterium]